MDNYSKVREALARTRSMSLVELMSTAEVPDDEVKEIVRRLLAEDLVKVSGTGESLDDIVTIRESLLRAAV